MDMDTAHSERTNKKKIGVCVCDDDARKKNMGGTHIPFIFRAQKLSNFALALCNCVYEDE